MPKHLSLATVVEKNRIASTSPFIMLAEIDVVNETNGNVEETLYLARNNEDVTYQAQFYRGAHFQFEIEETSDGVPSVSVSFYDPTGDVMARAEQYNGGVGWRVRLKYISTADLTLPPAIEELVYVVGATAQNYAIEFTLGARNPLTQRFPRRLQWRDRCPWIFKSRECGYTGAVATCDYTLQGNDGCASKNNTRRFGGFPGIRVR